MRSRESCRIGYLAALLGSAFLLAGGCAGNGNGGSSIGSGGNPAETGGVPSAGGAGGNTAADGNTAAGGTTAASSTGGSVPAGGNPVTSGGSRGTGGLPGAGGNPVAGGTTGAGGRNDAGAGRTASNAGGATGTGGTTSGAGGSTATPGKIFSQCRFHFGTLDSRAKSGGASLVAQLDFFTPGWMMGTFNQGSVCTESAPGGALAGLVPVDVTYIAANYVKNQNQLCDCNVSGCAGGNLCTGLGDYPCPVHEQLDGFRGLPGRAAHHLRHGARLVPVYGRWRNPEMDCRTGGYQHDGPGQCAEEFLAERGLLHGRITVDCQ